MFRRCMSKRIPQPANTTGYVFPGKRALAREQEARAKQEEIKRAEALKAQRIWAGKQRTAAWKPLPLRRGKRGCVWLSGLVK